MRSRVVLPVAVVALGLLVAAGASAATPGVGPGSLTESSAGAGADGVELPSVTTTENATASVQEFAIQIDEGLTIGDDYPRNQRELFATSDVYGLSGFSLPAEAGPADERFAPIADGQHVGLSGLPVQTEVYEWVTLNGLLGYQTDRPSQTVTVSAAPGDEGNLTLAYNETTAHGFQLLDDPATDPVEGVTDIAYANVDPANVTVTPQPDTDEIVVSFANGSLAPDQSPTVQFDLVWTAADPVAGLDVSRPSGIDYETDHRLVRADGDQVRDNFVVFEAGTTGISAADTNNTNGGFLGEPTDTVDLGSVPGSPGAADGTANDGSFLVWSDQVVTIETANRGQTVDIYETAVTDGTHTLGAKLPDTQLGFDDTAPGRVVNLDTANLSAGERYFVTFGGDTDEAVVLDVAPLGLDTTLSARNVPAAEFDEPFPVDVTSEDTTGGADIEARFYESGTTGVGEVVHVERAQLTGSGDRTVEIVPQVDLTDADGTFLGEGEYYAVVVHAESGATVTTERFELTPGQGSLVPAEDVQVVTPNLTAPDEPGVYDRGDIIPITLAMQGGTVGTLTFGDRDDQNVAVNVTVHDADGDGSATVYLNTYQVGHGLLHGDTPNRPSWIPTDEWENRQHGFFTDPASDDARIVGTVQAHPEMDIYGGSQGGAVLSPGQDLDGFRYDLHVTGGFVPFSVGDNRTDVNAVDIEQRSTDGFTLWTAPGEGPTAVDPTTADDITSGIEAGTVTEVETGTVTDGKLVRRVYEDTVAENDTLLLQVDASGVAGVLHEVVARNESLPVDAFLDATIQRDTADGDHLVTEPFRQALAGTVPRVGASLLRYRTDLVENRSAFQDRIGDTGPNLGPEHPDRVSVELSPDRVVAGLDDDDTLRRYFLPYELVPGEALVAPGTEAPFVGGLTMDTTIEFEPGGGAQAAVNETRDPKVPTSVNPPLDRFSNGFSQTDELEYATPTVSPDGLVDGVLTVPPRSDWTISGTTTTAPGTVLDARLVTTTGAETPFIQTVSDIETTAQPDGGPTTWSFGADFDETRDGVAIQPGTSFVLEMARTGTGLDPLLTPGAESVPGVVLPDPAVETFTVSEQTVTGAAVTVTAYEATRDTTIQLRDEAGTLLGESEVLAGGTRHETVAVPLDTVPADNGPVTATAVVTRPESGELLANRTATVRVEQPRAPQFRLRGLDPQAPSLPPATDMTVSVTVENVGDREGTRTLELTLDGDTAASAVVTVAGNSTTTAEFSVETPAEPGSYGLAVTSGNDTVSGALTVQRPATFQVLTLTPETATVKTGDGLSVSALVQNSGDRAGTREAVLSVGTRTESRTVTLPGGGSETVTFGVNTSTLSPGAYTHSVTVGNDSRSGSLTVQPVPPRFLVSDLDPSEVSVERGETVAVTLTVTNEGGTEGTQVVTLSSGSVRTNQSVTLPVGNSTTATLPLDTTPLDPGEYTLSVASDNDSTVGLLTVAAPENSTAAGTDAGGPGFGLVAAVLALLAVTAVRVGRPRG